MALALGIIGAGSIGSVHAQTAARLGIPVRAIWDVVPARAQALAESTGAFRAAADLEDLLRDPIVSAVVIATPNDTHADIACRALAAGKPVLLEKPMATSVAECDRIMTALEQTGLALQMGFVYRHAPAVRAIRALVDAGRFGRIYHAKCSMYRRRGIPGLGGWFTSRKCSGGGPLIDLGVHVIDAAQSLAGFPRAMRASGVTYANFGPRGRDYVYEEMWAGPPRYDGTVDVEDHATALVRFEGGLSLEVNVTWAANMPDRELPDGIALFGEHAGCRFTLLGTEVTIAGERGRELVNERIEFDSERALERAFEAQLRSFADVVERGGEPIATARHGRAVQAIIESIYRSSAEAREVEVR